MADEVTEIDYKAELKEVLASFDRAAEKGGEAVGQLRDGVTRLARLTQAALQGTQFEKQADLLALEMAKAGMTPETLHNAPLKVTRTGGADVYKVMDKLQKAAEAGGAVEVVQERPARAEAPREEAAPATESKSGRK